MASTPTTSNRFNKQGTGDNTGSWGIILNEQDFDLIDTALDGTSVIVVSGNVVGAAANYLPDQVRARTLKFTGSGGSFQIPSVSKTYLVNNACTGAVTVKTASAAGATIPAGTVTPIYCDGVDVVASTNLWPLLDGTAALPTAYFQNDTNTGLYRIGADALGIAAGGTKIIEANTSGAVITGSATVSFGAIVNDGTAAIPAVRFASDTNTGFYRVGSDALGVSVGGAKLFEVNATGVVVPGDFRVDTLSLNGGNATAPAIRILGDTDTGLYAPNPNRLGVAVGGVEMLDVSATGIIIPGDVRASTITINAGTVAAPSIRVSGDTDTGIYTPAANRLALVVGGVDMLDCSTTGIVIPADVRSATHTLNGGAVSAPSLTVSGDSNTGLYWPAADTLGVVVGGIEAGRLFSGGAYTVLRLGDTDYSYSAAVAALSIGYLGVGSQYGIVLRPQTDTTIAVQFTNASGTQIGSISQTASATTYNTVSDRRMKDDIVDLDNSGAFVDALTPRAFTWLADGTRAAGFIADEVALVSPSSVTGEVDAVAPDGQPLYQGMMPGSPEIIANLVAEIKALRARVATLEAA